MYKNKNIFCPIIVFLFLLLNSFETQSFATKIELLKNPGFESGTGNQPIDWIPIGKEKEGVTFSWDSEYRHSGNASIAISSQNEMGVNQTYWVQKITDIPENKELIIEGYIKTSSGGKAWVWIDCKNGEGKTIWFDYATPSIREGWIMEKPEWTKVWCIFVPPKGTSVVEIRLKLFGKGKVWYDDFSVTLGGKAKARLYPERMKGPGIANATGRYCIYGIKKEEGRPIYLTPIPSIFENQVPFYFEVKVDPPEFLSKYSIKKRLTGNSALEIEFMPIPEDKHVILEWNAYVLLPDKNYEDFTQTIPIAKEEDIPPEIKKWLYSTKCVQSDNPEIIKKAKELKGDSINLMEVTRTILNFHQKVIRSLRGARACDAVSTLHGGGACTSFANLTAAILRASGIPARVMANYPTWGRPYATHYNVEFYAHEHGWYWFDTIVGKMPIKPYEQVVVVAIYPEDENKSFAKGRNAAPGVPWGTLIEPINPCGTWVTGALDRRGGQTIAGPAKVFIDGTEERWKNAFEITKSVWERFIENKIIGKEIPRAIEMQKEASDSSNLQEFIERMEKIQNFYKKISVKRN